MIHVAIERQRALDAAYDIGEMLQGVYRVIIPHHTKPKNLIACRDAITALWEVLGDRMSYRDESDHLTIFIEASRFLMREYGVHFADVCECGTCGNCGCKTTTQII